MAGTSPQKFAGLGAAVAFVAVGVGIVYHSGYWVGLFGYDFSGVTWCLVGFIAGWIATTRQHAEPRLREISAAGAQEHIISRPDADLIFAFARADWERYVRQVGQPEGWVVRPLPLESGTVLARFNQSMGMGASIQPLYVRHDQGPPEMVIVGRYYPVGFMRLSDEGIKKIEQDVRLELGPSYSVSASHAKMSGTNLEGFELIVTRERVDPRGSMGAER